jgi:Na+/H+ antiporter NhaD/arsenite permease-like protein
MNVASYVTIPVVLMTVIGVAVSEFPELKMNRATIALAAAVLLVALGLVSPSAALRAVDPNTLLLLFAMLVIAAYLRMAGFFGRLTHLVIWHIHPPHGLLAALFLNDTVVIVFTPLVLDVTHTCAAIRSLI